MAARPRLNDRQTEVLQWIAAGCPARDWPDYAHRQSARALASRGLVEIRGHGPTWTATITDAGRARLEGDSQEQPRRTAKRQGHGRKAKDVDVTAQTLLDALTANGGTLTVPAPSPSVRGAYRRALAALQQTELAEGHRVTYRGRDRSDLFIRLTDAPREQAPPGHVPMPSAPDPDHPVVRALRSRLRDLEVSDSSHERVMLLHQALADEAGRRGHACTVPAAEPGDPKTATLVVSIGEVDVDFRMHEETEKVQVVPNDELQKIRYDWQRAPLRKEERFCGRLVLTLENGAWNPPWWADRKRWTLDGRLPQALQAAEEWAEQVRQQRETADLERRERRRAWDTAVPKAQAAFVEALNRGRAEDQLAAFARSRDLRAYADVVETHAGPLPRHQRDGAREWAEWIRAEAERADPLSRADELRYDRPEELPATEVDRYMPRGMTSARPPD